MRRVHHESAGSIYCGDAADYFANTDAAWMSELVVITDPPYGAGKYSEDKAPPDELLRRLIAEPKCSAIFNWPEDLVAMCVRLQVVPDEWVTWWAPNKTHPRSAGLTEAECVAVFGNTYPRRVRLPRSPEARALTESVNRRCKHKGGDGHNTGRTDPNLRQAGDVWMVRAPGIGFQCAQRRHPNEKPLELMERLVLLCSDPGDTILDPFMGSGTTLEAAKKLGRKFIGVELNEKHCRTAVERLRQGVLPLEVTA